MACIPQPCCRLRDLGAPKHAGNAAALHSATPSPRRPTRVARVPAHPRALPTRRPPLLLPLPPGPKPLARPRQRGEPPPAGRRPAGPGAAPWSCAQHRGCSGGGRGALPQLGWRRCPDRTAAAVPQPASWRACWRHCGRGARGEGGGAGARGLPCKCSGGERTDTPRGRAQNQHHSPGPTHAPAAPCAPAHKHGGCTWIQRCGAQHGSCGQRAGGAGPPRWPCGRRGPDPLQAARALHATHARGTAEGRRCATCHLCALGRVSVRSSLRGAPRVHRVGQPARPQQPRCAPHPPLQPSRSWRGQASWFWTAPFLTPPLGGHRDRGCAAHTKDFITLL